MSKNIFSSVYQKKSDAELLQTLINRSMFQAEATEAAINELGKRGIKFDPSQESFDDDLREFQHEILEAKRIEVHTKVAKQANLKSDWQTQQNKLDKKTNLRFWWAIDKTHLKNLIGFYALAMLLMYIFNLPYFDVYFNEFFFGTFLLIITLWQVSIISNSLTKRILHFAERIIFSLFFTAYFFSKFYLIDDIIEQKSFDKVLWIFLFILSFSSIVSLILFYFIPEKILTARFYFLNNLKYFIPVFVIVLIVLTGRRESAFIDKEYIKWSDKKPLTENDFKGYSNWFTHYDGAIKSYLDFKFKGNSLLYLDATCIAHETWIDPGDKGSYTLLQHEQYHFNITEMVTRIARKAIVDTMRYGSDLAGVKKIIKRHQKIRNMWQGRYDDETDHSVIRDMQGYWQFKIDSMLTELDPYWSSEVLHKINQQDSVRYFRQMILNGNRNLAGLNELMNGEEHYTDHYRFYYDSAFRVTSIWKYFQNHLVSDNIYGSAIIEIDYTEKTEIHKHLDITGIPMINDDGYHSVVVERAEYSIQESFFNIKDEPIENVSGVHENRISLDILGRAYEKKRYDLEGMQTFDNTGMFNSIYGYQDSSLLISFILNYHSEAGEILNHAGVHEWIYEYDNNGNEVFYAKKDINGDYVETHGVSIIKKEFDELGFLKNKCYFDKDQEPVELDGASKFSFAYDRFGNVTRESFYNVNDVLTLYIDEYASKYQKYDDKNNLICIAKYDTGDKLLFDDSGIGKLVYQYDNNGNIIEHKNLDGYDFPVRSDYGGSIRRISIDKSATETKQTWTNFSHKMQADTSKLGVAISTYTYDIRGNLLKQSFNGPENKLVAVQEDVATFRYKYDEHNNKIETKYFNIEEELAIGNQGVSINEYDYSTDNRLMERRYYDSLYSLAPFDGYAKIQWQYDKRGNEIKKWYYNKNNKLVTNEPAVEENFYNDKNKLIERRNYDSLNQLIQTEPAIIKYKRNSFGFLIKIQRFDHRGRPTIDEKGVHIYEFDRDNDGNYTSERYYDSQKQPIEINGIFELRHDYDKRENELAEYYFDQFSKPFEDENYVAKYVYEYNIYDHLIRETFFGKDGKPALYDSLYAEARFRRNTSGNAIEKVFYDQLGKVTIDEDSVAMYRVSYDRNGYRTLTSFSLKEALKIFN